MGECIPFAPTESTSVEHAYQIIQQAITTRREAFIADYQAGKYGSEFQTYEDELDRAVYKTLGEFRGSNQEAFRQAKEKLDAYTTFQLETFIGERLNVGLSSHEYAIHNGELYGNNMEEPLVDMIDRGRQTRNAQVDQLLKEKKISPETAEQIKQRHDAEVEQFKKIREFIRNPKALPGTSLISISPPGPGYVHNFYDVFTLKERSDKTRYIEARRYTSALTAEQSLEQLQNMQPTYGQDRGEKSLIPYFLETPFILDDPLDPRFNNPDGVHAYLQSDENAMTEADFRRVKEVIAGVISIYLKEVFQHPDDAATHAKILDALRNKADWAATEIRKQKINVSMRRENVLPIDKAPTDMTLVYAAAHAGIDHFGALPVRVASTGCGKDGSSRKKRGSSSIVTIGDMLPGNMSSFSLLDDILDSADSEGFECPNCHRGRVKGKKCPACGITDKQWAEKVGVANACV